MIITPEYEYKLIEYLKQNHHYREQLFEPSFDTTAVYTTNNNNSNSNNNNDHNNGTNYSDGNNNNSSSNNNTSNKNTSHRMHKYNPSEYGLCEKRIVTRNI